MQERWKKLRARRSEAPEIKNKWKRRRMKWGRVREKREGGGTGYDVLVLHGRSGIKCRQSVPMISQDRREVQASRSVVNREELPGESKGGSV